MDWNNLRQTCYLTGEFLGVHGAQNGNIIGCGTGNEMSISNLFLSLEINLTVLQHRSGGRVCVCVFLMTLYLNKFDGDSEVTKFLLVTMLWPGSA